MTDRTPKQPYANGEDRDPNTGRFRPGNAVARGRSRPHAAKVAELRQALLDAIDPSRIAKIVMALADAAEGGNVAAARVLLDRVFGPPVAEDILQRIEALEEETEARR